MLVLNVLLSFVGAKKKKGLICGDHALKHQRKLLVSVTCIYLMVSSFFPTMAVSQRWKEVCSVLLPLSIWLRWTVQPVLPCLLRFIRHNSYSAARPACNSLCLICIQSLLKGSYFATEQKIKMMFTGLTVCPKPPFTEQCY